jgi:multidrug resistance efflux pump
VAFWDGWQLRLKEWPASHVKNRQPTSPSDQGRSATMLEMLLCSLFTIVPDYLYRRYAQGKHIGREITIYSVWYELRYGITACLMLTVSLITMIFYFHPSTSNVVGLYRAIPIVTEISGRVAEVYTGVSGEVKQGTPIFKLDSSKQQAALDVARRKLAEIDAKMVSARADIAAAEGQVQEAKASYEQAVDELRTKQSIAHVVARREIEKLQKLVEGRLGTLNASHANKQAAETRLSTLLPAEKATAEANERQAQVDLSKTVVYAGVSGRVEQFILRPGDIVNPLMRPAGVLIPAGVGGRLLAGFGQIEAQVIKTGMIGEVTCVSKPLTIIPVVVTGVQEYIAAGQVRSGEQLIDLQNLSSRPGTLTVFLEPLYEGGLDDVTAGSSCIANVYTNNHDRIAKGDLGFGKKVALHVVDTVAIVHAMILRLQALVLPIKVLVGMSH